MQIRYFAAAADAAGCADEQADAPTLGDLLASLTASHGEHFGRVLARCSLLLDGVRVDDPATDLTSASRLDVLPPFAGG